MRPTSLASSAREAQAHAPTVPAPCNRLARQVPTLRAGSPRRYDIWPARHPRPPRPARTLPARRPRSRDRLDSTRRAQASTRWHQAPRPPARDDASIMPTSSTVRPRPSRPPSTDRRPRRLDWPPGRSGASPPRDPASAASAHRRPRHTRPAAGRGGRPGADRPPPVVSGRHTRQPQFSSIGGTQLGAELRIGPGRSLEAVSARAPFPAPVRCPDIQLARSAPGPCPTAGRFPPLSVVKRGKLTPYWG